MASVVLVMLAASRVSALRRLMASSIVEIGPHVNGLLTQWIHIPGRGTSPSVTESVKLIGNASTLLSLTWNDNGLEK